MDVGREEERRGGGGGSGGVETGGLVKRVASSC